MFGIIVNPVSGGGKNKAIVDQIEALLRERGEECRLFPTEYRRNSIQGRIALDCRFP